MYCQMLEQQIIPQIRESYGAQFDNVWWMQDGAPCHRRVLVSNYIRETFQNRIIGFGFEREWPPRSPDLTTCYFFFSGGILNQRCTYSTPPQNLEELKERIEIEMTELKNKPLVVRNVMRKVREKCQACLAKNGGQVN